MKNEELKETQTPAQLIDRQIAELAGWRGEMLAQVRKLVLEAAPGITEEWKWDTAVWAQNGLLCSVGAFKDHIKINFFKGASLEDPAGLFNAGLYAKATRAIDYSENDVINQPALRDLIGRAVAYNLASKKK